MIGTRIIGAVALGGLLCVVGGCGSKGSDVAGAGGSSPVSTTTAGVGATVPTPSVSVPTDVPTDVPSTDTSTNTNTSTDTSTGTAAGALDVCSVMSPSALTQITGTTYTKTEPDSTSGVIFSCNYTNAKYDQLTISVTVTGGAIGYQSILDTLHTMGSDPNPVAGVGDKAFSQNDPKGNAGSVGVSAFASFGALFGDVFIQTSGLDYITAAQGTQIANQIHAAM